MRRRRLRVACPERDTDVAGGLSWVSVSNAFSRVAFRCLVMKDLQNGVCRLIQQSCYYQNNIAHREEVSDNYRAVDDHFLLDSWWKR